MKVARKKEKMELSCRCRCCCCCIAVTNKSHFAAMTEPKKKKKKKRHCHFPHFFCLVLAFSVYLHGEQLLPDVGGPPALVRGLDRERTEVLKEKK